jgi:hypothetical protein
VRGGGSAGTDEAVVGGMKVCFPFVRSFVCRPAVAVALWPRSGAENGARLHTGQDNQGLAPGSAPYSSSLSI